MIISAEPTTDNRFVRIAIENIQDILSVAIDLTPEEAGVVADEILAAAREATT